MKEKLPNIVFIVMDTAGAKHMSLYGYHRQTTPNLERLAEESVVYTRCFAPACWTIPSHASMFTGLYPSQHGAFEGKFILNSNIHHLVPALKMLGYRTLGISSNDLVDPASGLCPGFDYFKNFGSGFLGLFGNQLIPKESAPELGLPTRLAKTEKTGEKLKILLNHACATGRYQEVLQIIFKSFLSRLISPLDKPLGLRPLTKSSRYSKKTVKLIPKILNSNSYGIQTPFFLFMNFLDPHAYYRPPFRWRQFSKWYDKCSLNLDQIYDRYSEYPFNSFMDIYRNLYDDEIFHLDHIIYEIYNLFKYYNLDDNTVFIITSDHGEHLGEKGIIGHCLSLYNELVWVPLIIRFPAHFRRIGQEDRLVSLNDLYATILDLAKSPLPRPETSVSLLNQAQREFTISQIVYPEIWMTKLKAIQELYAGQGSKFSPPIMAVVTQNGKKLIAGADGSLQVYDLHQDMFENQDLSPRLDGAVLEGYHHLLDYLKAETGFNEAAEKLRNRDVSQIAIFS